METKNYSNQDLKKIERWATDNKIEFNDKDLRFYLYQGKETTTERLILHTYLLHGAGSFLSS
jgi:hypothetical protein